MSSVTGGGNRVRPAAMVGIGASAGGLEALETFFDHMPTDSGTAFVVVQHLSPDFKSLMDELLSRHTRLAIHRVTDGMLVEPNSIYLIPPKKEMIVSGGRLLLTDKDPSQPLPLPIDVFFRSLAQDAGHRAIGVILSGTGSDGSRGIRAIHEAGGLVFVQSPETAKFDGMPKSALDTGVVDYVLPPESIPAAIVRHVAHGDRVEDESLPLPAVSEQGINAIFRILRDEYGIDFSHYKQSTVMRRVERRLQLNRSIDLDEYVARLRDDSAELNALYKDLLIGVTEFFRDAEAFQSLDREVIPGLFERVSPHDELRIWVAGCGTGEEAYSIAILIDEAMQRMGLTRNIKIFATDVHRASLDFASAGVYDRESLIKVSPERMERYFVARGDQFQVSQELRKTIVFAPHNVLKDAPFTKLDLISCRNLLIYFQPLAQKKVLSLFHFGLKAGGVMFLGPSESPGELSEEFQQIDAHWKIFRKRRDIRLPADLRLPLAPGSVPTRATAALGVGHGPGAPDLDLLRAYDAMLERFVPPGLLLNPRRQLVHTFGGAGRFLSPRDGRTTTDALDLVQKELKLVLAGAIQRAVRDLATVTYSGVRVRAGNGEEELSVQVTPLAVRDAAAPYLLVTFESSAARRPASPADEQLDLQRMSGEQMRSLEDELRYTKENLQATIEELETANEELQATNEELVASNEELQSTNEELHSVNEELYTVNAEHQRKIAQLTQLTNDMNNLLESIDVGTLFLDRDLCIRKFTPRITEVFHILPQDVGRRIDSFASNIDCKSLLDDIGAVLATNQPREQEVQDRQGRWYLLRILPYRVEGSVDGAVVTLIDVCRLKQVEKNLRLMSKVFQDAADPIIIEDLNGTIIDVNAETERAYGYTRDELIGEKIAVLMAEQEVRRSINLRRRCVSSEAVRNVETVRRDKYGREHPVLLTLSLLTDERNAPVAIASIAKDISVQKNAEAVAQEAIERRDQFLAILSHELRNPLSAVLNGAYVLSARLDDRPEVREPCRVIQRQAKQMARLLDDLLDVSRITQGRIEIRREQTDLRSAIESAVEVMRPQIEARDLTLHVHLDSRPLSVFGDAARLEQIAVNLLTNAMKYTPAGGEIRLTAMREEGRIVLRVADSGHGIAPEMLDRIFELFVQAGKPIDRADGGMGVGLTLVRSLVELHGGTIAAFSEGPDKGSEFVVQLPPGPQPDEEAAAAEAEPRCRAPQRILLIEDNADSRQMLRSVLEMEGFSVEAVEDGRHGLELLLHDHFDLALVDIGLPGIDGFEIARQVRASPRGRAIRMVALTGYGRPADCEATRAAGFDEHLVKPIRRDNLAQIVQLPRRNA